MGKENIIKFSGCYKDKDNLNATENLINAVGFEVKKLQTWYDNEYRPTDVELMMLMENLEQIHFECERDILGIPEDECCNV